MSVADRDGIILVSEEMREMRNEVSRMIAALLLLQFLIPSAGMERRITMKYECEPCGYIYDPEAGDPEGGIAPGTAFEDIPDDWVCPICGAGKDAFVPAE